MRMPVKVTHMGLDSHNNFSRVTARDEQGRVAWRGRMEHGDRQKVRQELAQWPKVPVVLEGTFGWGWLSDEMRAAGQQPHLASSRKVAGWRDARGLAKSNKIDADLLSELWTEKQRWWEVWLAPPEVGDQREWLRYRMTLVRLQTGIKNRIHATMHRHGLIHPFSDLFGVKGLMWLGQMSQEQQSQEQQSLLRESTRATLAGYLRLLKQLRKQLAEVTREMRRQIRRSAVGELWRSLPGVSFILAYTILAEVGEVARFQNGRRLSKYGLLAPMADDSGDEDDAAPPGRHVGHLGRVTLQWAFITAARGASRKSDHFKAIFNRRSDNGTRDRQRAYIAVAHELCRVGYSCVKNQRSFIEQRPPRPQPSSCPARSCAAGNDCVAENGVSPPAESKPESSRPEVRRARSPLGRRRGLAPRHRASL